MEQVPGNPTAPDRVPSIFMLVPGPWRDPRDVLRVLRAQGIAAGLADGSPVKPHQVRVDVVEDDQLAAGFGWGRSGPLPDEVLARIAQCNRAALIECGDRLQDAAGELGRVGRALREAGGMAVRMEASGSASPWEPWLDHVESREPFHLYLSGVLLVRGESGIVFTCGMHQFDLPDAQIAAADLADAAAWLDGFCVYQVAEQPTLLSGHTFRPDADAPRRSIERWPDHRHDPQDGRYNPFGLWRLVEPADCRIKPTRTVPLIVPSLVALLTSAERAAGYPLTRQQVEEIVASSPAIVMEPHDVAVLERSRGYADLEPELAWEQWQIVRDAM